MAFAITVCRRLEVLALFGGKKEYGIFCFKEGASARDAHRCYYCARCIGEKKRMGALEYKHGDPVEWSITFLQLA
jgi:hypothetical protein